MDSQMIRDGYDKEIAYVKFRLRYKLEGLEEVSMEFGKRFELDEVYDKVIVKSRDREYRKIEYCIKEYSETNNWSEWKDASK